MPDPPNLIQSSPNPRDRGIPTMTRTAKVVVFALSVAALASTADRKRKKEEETQILEIPKEPPAYVVAEASRLVFRSSPLESKGLLSHQVREGLQWLLRENRGEPIVKLRAFVAGTGDMRRVQAIVSEVFTGKNLALPALTVVQVGALPQEGAQVALESTAVDKKAVNRDGLAFLSGQGASAEQPFQPVLPLFEQSLARLRATLGAAGLDSNDLLRVTCYLSSLDDAPAVRGRAYAENPRAAWSFIQRTREPADSRAECEAVARLRRPPASGLVLTVGPETAELSAIALAGPGPLAFTGMQLAFGRGEADARLAFGRLGKTLEAAHASWSRVAVLDVYPLSRPLGELVRKTGWEFATRARPPAGTTLRIEGLPSLDASFALDAIALPAAPQNPQ